MPMTAIRSICLIFAQQSDPTQLSHAPPSLDTEVSGFLVITARYECPVESS